MLTRREFSASALGAAGLSLLTVHEVKGQSLPVVRLGNAAGLIDPQVTFLTMGQHPKLDYYRKEGCVLEIVNMSGAGQTMQAIASGNSDTSAVPPIVFLPIYVKNPKIDIVFPYCWLRQQQFSVGVKPDSPIQKLEDLKGKTLGIRNQGDTGYFGAKAMFKELGINPEKDVEWISIGEGGPAGEAVYKGRVDAMAFWDSAFARIEVAGFPFRFLANTPGVQKAFGNGYCVRKSDLPAKRDLYVRFFRAMAMSTVFAYENVDTSIRLHWEIYPESKPKGKSDEEAMKEARIVVNARKDKWLPGAWQADKRFGSMTTDEWLQHVKFAGLEKEITDVSPMFTTELLDDINNFDPKPIQELARTMKL